MLGFKTIALLWLSLSAVAGVDTESVEISQDGQQRQVTESRSLLSDESGEQPNDAARGSHGDESGQATLRAYKMVSENDDERKLGRRRMNRAEKAGVVGMFSSGFTVGGLGRVYDFSRSSSKGKGGKGSKSSKGYGYGYGRHTYAPRNGLHRSMAPGFFYKRGYGSRYGKGM